MQSVLRQEHKYLINQMEYRKFSHKLSQCMEEDAHNCGTGYLIRSLYFDTIDNRDYWEKLEGVEVRRKIRLRNYSSGDDCAYLEMKQKQGSDQHKRSLRLPREDSARLCAGDYSPLLGSTDSFALECYGLMQMRCYRPQTVVQYRRKAFTAKENRIRITFDSEVCANEANFNIFSPELSFNPVFNSNNVIMEVKYNGFLLSYIKDLLNTCNRSSLSVSKYCLGRSVGMNDIF